MSLDLVVVRGLPLSWTDARRACDAVAKANGGAVSFWSMTEDAEDTNAYFWNADRASVSIVVPMPEVRE